MNFKKLLICVISIGLISCKINKTDNKPKNDTTRVIEFAIKTSFETKLLPEIKALKSQYPFKDSILFTSEFIPLSVLPKSLDSLKFKIISRKEILRILKNDSLNKNLPNYLIVDAFEKTDSSYFIQISNLSIIPFDGGGEISMNIISQKGNLILRHRSISNIN